jgi:hypothetical protein
VADAVARADASACVALPLRFGALDLFADAFEDLFAADPFSTLPDFFADRSAFFPAAGLVVTFFFAMDVPGGLVVMSE